MDLGLPETPRRRSGALIGATTVSGFLTGLCHPPVGEQVEARFPAGLDQGGHAGASLEELLQQPVQRVLFTFDPIRRDAFPGLVDDLLGSSYLRGAGRAPPVLRAIPGWSAV